MPHVTSDGISNSPSPSPLCSLQKNANCSEIYKNGFIAVCADKLHVAYFESRDFVN